MSPWNKDGFDWRMPVQTINGIEKKDTVEEKYSHY